MSEKSKQVRDTFSMRSHSILYMYKNAKTRMIQKGSFLEIGSLCSKGFLQSSGLYNARDQHQFICTFPLQVKNRTPKGTNLNSHQHDVLNF